MFRKLILGGRARQLGDVGRAGLVSIGEPRASASGERRLSGRCVPPPGDRHRCGDMEIRGHGKYRRPIPPRAHRGALGTLSPMKCHITAGRNLDFGYQRRPAHYRIDLAQTLIPVKRDASGPIMQTPFDLAEGETMDPNYKDLADWR